MRNEVVFGSRWKILYLRVIQVIVGCGFILFHPQGSEPAAAWLGAIPFVLAETALYRIVYARLTRDGIEYLRWGRWRLVSWADIKNVTQRRYVGTVSLQLAGRPLWSRFLFLGSPSPPLSSVIHENEGASRLSGLISR